MEIQQALGRRGYGPWPDRRMLDLPFVILSADFRIFGAWATRLWGYPVAFSRDVPRSAWRIAWPEPASEECLADGCDMRAWANGYCGPHQIEPGIYR